MAALPSRGQIRPSDQEKRICLYCDNEELVLKVDGEIEQEFRGETFILKSPVMVCPKCGYQALMEGQLDKLGQLTSDAYRKKHGLLTSQQIRKMRHALKMSQSQFAKFLRVGEASIKRWEGWAVQDASNDELIRVKCILAKKDIMIKKLKCALASNTFSFAPHS